MVLGRLKRQFGAPGGVALVRALREHLELSWAQAQQLVKLGKVHVAGLLALDPCLEPAAGLEISVDTDRKRPSRRVVPGPQCIVLREAELVVVNKPAGLATMPPTRTGERTLAEHLPELLGGVPVFPVHRLDAGTSGLMVFALTSGAADRLEAMLREHLVRRQYVALVHGHPTPGQQFDKPVPGSEEDRVAQLSALSRCLSVDPRGPLALLRMELETGRRHQLRFHLADAGFPIVGDPLYGQPELDKPLHPPRMFLHSASLDLDWEGRHLHLDCPLPEELQGFLGRITFS
jgi:23S rRNA pseudouridine1911/1915/1917 synthase